MSKVNLNKEVTDKLVISAVDRELLNKAIADYHQTVIDVNNHRLEIDKLQGQINELNDEIARLQSVEFNLSADLSIQNIKNFANEKYKARLELETLIDIRDKLSDKLPELMRDFSAMYSNSVLEANKHCWSILYSALLSKIDFDLFKQLLAVGVISGMSKDTIIQTFNKMPVEFQQLDPLAEMFGIPHDE